MEENKTNENQEIEPEVLGNEVEQHKKKCEEYLNNWKRTAADFANYKKDEMGRMAMLLQYGKEDMILKILPILDNIELAEKQLPESLRTKAKESQSNGLTRASTELSRMSSPQVEWTKGFLQIQNQIKEFLKKEGIEEVKTVGEKFNPETMEIIGEVDGDTSGIVAEELQKGYMLEDKVLRPAKIKVTK